MDGEASESAVSLQRDVTKSEVLPVAGGLAAVYSAPCPEKQGVNEDAAAVIPFSSESGILVVADGVGGLRAGEQASQLAVHGLRESLERASSEGLGLREAILNGFELANEAVAALGSGAATTLAVVEIQGRTVRPYHVGDSMILVVGQRGKVKLQTVSHSPVGYAVAAGLLDEMEALHHEERHLISNMLGAADMRIEIGSSLALAPRDTLLLASDGLFDNLHVEEIVERIRKGPLKRVLRTLADDTLERMRDPAGGEPSKPDDLTFIAFRCHVPRTTSR